jgi:hypothetical protein
MKHVHMSRIAAAAATIVAVASVGAASPAKAASRTVTRPYAVGGVTVESTGVVGDVCSGAAVETLLGPDQVPDLGGACFYGMIVGSVTEDTLDIAIDDLTGETIAARYWMDSSLGQRTASGSVCGSATAIAIPPDTAQITVAVVKETTPVTCAGGSLPTAGTITLTLSGS